MNEVVAAFLVEVAFSILAGLTTGYILFRILKILDKRKMEKNIIEKITKQNNKFIIDGKEFDLKNIASDTTKFVNVNYKDQPIVSQIPEPHNIIPQETKKFNPKDISKFKRRI